MPTPNKPTVHRLADTSKMSINGALKYRGLPIVNRCSCDRIISANKEKCAGCSRRPA